MLLKQSLPRAEPRIYQEEAGVQWRIVVVPGGKLVVIDFIPKPWAERPWGPPESQHLSEETLTADLAEAGLKRVAKHDFVSEQFFVVYKAE